MLTIAVTVIVSLVVDFAGKPGDELLNLLALDKVAVAQGEIWRLWTVTLVHAPLVVNPFHLLMNMYALYLAGPFVERMYGRVTFLAIYLAAAAGASLTSFAFGTNAQYAVGASGAIFGLFGLLISVHFVHRPMLDRATRGFMGQLVALVILNLVLGATMGGIDNWAHVGGLITGIWLGVLLVPSRVPTMRSMWLRTGPTPGTVVPAFGQAGNTAIRVAGIVAMLGFFVLLWIIGVGYWGSVPV
jgi:rhomboid protease GluP